MEASLLPGCEGRSQSFPWMWKPAFYLEAKAAANLFPKSVSQPFTWFKGVGNLFPECGCRFFTRRRRWKPAFYLEAKAEADLSRNVEASLLSGGEDGIQSFSWRWKQGFYLKKPAFYLEAKAKASLYLETTTIYQSYALKVESSLLTGGDTRSRPFTWSWDAKVEDNHLRTLSGTTSSSWASSSSSSSLNMKSLSSVSIRIHNVSRLLFICNNKCLGLAC